MLKYIAEWLEVVLTVAAFLIVASVGMTTFGFALSSGAGGVLATFSGLLGVLLGFVLASVILGIPIVLVRINKNVEETKQILTALSNEITKHGGKTDTGGLSNSTK